MPRQARLDAPGTLHHVIVRGIEKGRVGIMFCLGLERKRASRKGLIVNMFSRALGRGDVRSWWAVV